MTKNNLTSLFRQKKPWTHNNNKIWLASTISLSRNIEKFKFPSKLEKERRKQIISFVGKDLLQSKSLSHPKLIQSEQIVPLEKQ